MQQPLLCYNQRLFSFLSATTRERIAVPITPNPNIPNLYFITISFYAKNFLTETDFYYII